MSNASQSSRPPQRWTEGRILDCLRPVLAEWRRQGGEGMPTRAFIQARDSRLEAAIGNRGGLRRFAPRLGCEAPSRGQRRYWTRERLWSEMLAFAKTHGRLPSHRPGERELYYAALKLMHAADWRAALGLSEPPRGRRRSAANAS